MSLQEVVPSFLLLGGLGGCQERCHLISRSGIKILTCSREGARDFYDLRLHQLFAIVIGNCFDL